MAFMIIKKVGDKTVVKGKRACNIEAVDYDAVVVEFETCCLDEDFVHFHVAPVRGKSVGLRLPLEKIEAAFDEALPQLWPHARVYEVNWEFAQQRVSQNGFV